MTLERTRITVTITAVLAMSTGGAPAYTVVTQDGHTIHVMSRPEVRGPQALMRLQPGGQLAVIAEARIDWRRTEEANPVVAPIAIPASTMMTESGAPAQRVKPIDLKLYGGKVAQGAPGAVTLPPSQQKTISGEAIINLQKEYAQVMAARDAEAAARQTMEQELAQLQARDVGYASETSANEQRIRELVEKIAAAGSRIGMLDGRLGDIRSEVVQLGGTID